MTTQIKLTASQEREILRAENWPPDCSLTREGKLDIGREQIAFERKAVREGYAAKSVETLVKRIRVLERAERGRMELIGDFIGKTIKGVLKDQCVMKFRGVYSAADKYTRGDVCTHGGSLFCAIDKCQGSTPGKSPDWKLVAKAGSAP